MNTVPTNMVEVSCQGIASIRGPAANMPIFMLKDKQERSIAIPLSRLQSELLQHTLGGNIEDPQPPQPYRTLLSCFEKLGVELGAVHIHFTSEYDLPTHLILRPKSVPDFEVAIPCSDGIVYSKLSGVPIYVDEKLMATIGTHPSNSYSNIIVDTSQESNTINENDSSLE
jgi:bifunctional DNase/RNase